MVNLRYHIVSIVAVFLALGVGIVMGATVVDRGIVDALNRRVSNVENSLKTVRESNRRKDAQLKVWSDFTDQGRDQLLQGRLKDVPVMLVAVRGVDARPIDDLRRQLGVAQASLEGTLWLTQKLRLDNDGDTRALAGVLAVAPDRPEVIRQALVGRLATLFSGAEPDAALLPALTGAGFMDFEPPVPPPEGGTDLGALPAPGTRDIVISGAGARVADDQLAVPLAQSMALNGASLLAAESGRDTPGGRSVFVGLLRTNTDVSGRIATLDNLESFVGQAATILALEDLGVPRVGHFGVGPDAQRLLPAAPAP